MTKWLIISGLVVLNLILGTAVYQKVAERKANAQIGAQKLNIASVAGVLNGQTVIYMLDVNSGALVAVRFDANNRQINRIATRNVAADLRAIR
jgi:hypothetical protein